jgi:hypothetical protein
MTVYGELRYSSRLSLSGHWTEMVDQLHDTVAFPPGERITVIHRIEGSKGSRTG